MKKKYTVPFRGQQFKRTSEREYTHAWAVIGDETGTVHTTGFSRDLAAAQKAGSSELSYRRKVSGYDGFVLEVAAVEVVSAKKKAADTWEPAEYSHADDVARYPKLATKEAKTLGRC